MYIRVQVTLARITYSSLISFNWEAKQPLAIGGIRLHHRSPLARPDRTLCSSNVVKGKGIACDGKRAAKAAAGWEKKGRHLRDKCYMYLVPRESKFPMHGKCKFDKT